VSAGGIGAFAASDRDGLEKILRYIARPPLSEDRLSRLNDGRVAVRLKTPWRDGTTHVAFTPMEFIEKLVALIPRPRAHQIRYHGILAPAAGDRARVVPGVKVVRAEVSAQKGNAWKWADLMRRVFALDVLKCPHCEGRMRVLGVVIKRVAIEQVLALLDLPCVAPVRHPARPPPEIERPNVSFITKKSIGRWVLVFARDRGVREDFDPNVYLMSV